MPMRRKQFTRQMRLLMWFVILWYVLQGLS